MSYQWPSSTSTSSWWPAYDWSLYDDPTFISSSPSPVSFADSDSSPLSLSPPPSVKEEQDDPPSGCFIMELSAPQALISQSLAPPTEVPLRATQASTDMRRMMNVFRLNPFTIHSGAGRGTVPVHYETAHPLDAEPLIFEFQLDLEPGTLDPDGTTEELDDLRSFSPDFELYEKVKDTVAENDTWYDFGEVASPSPSWNLSYPDSEERFSSINIPSYHHPLPSRRPPRSHNCMCFSLIKLASTLISLWLSLLHLTLPSVFQPSPTQVTLKKPRPSPANQVTTQAQAYPAFITTPRRTTTTTTTAQYPPSQKPTTSRSGTNYSSASAIIPTAPQLREAPVPVDTAA
ncbi:hypothetical protein C0991_009859 [Blastosporella zonata]|nr:hypothetical protein C0991_009859 [Blastosporella zonata]